MTKYLAEYLDVFIYSKLLVREYPGKTCGDIVASLFGTRETAHILEDLKDALCNDTKHFTDLSTYTGWKLFLQSHQYKDSHYSNILESYIHEKIPDFTVSLHSHSIQYRKPFLIK